MGYQPYSCGWTRLVSSGQVSDAGKPILITGYSLLSGSTASVPYFINGSATGTIAFRGQGVASNGSNQAYTLPPMLSNGCYVSFDANTTEVTVFYVLQSVSS
jgi:hypothetical protein